MHAVMSCITLLLLRARHCFASRCRDARCAIVLTSALELAEEGQCSLHRC